MSETNETLSVQWIGYVGRAISHTQTPDWTLVPYLIQTLLLLVAPALFAASIYMELSRIIILVDGESHVLIKKKWLTKTFVTGDVLSFFIQGGGKLRHLQSIYLNKNNWLMTAI